MGKAAKSKKKLQDRQTPGALDVQVVSTGGEVYINLSRPVRQIHFNAAQAAQFGRAVEEAAAKANAQLVKKLQELATAVGGADKLREIATRARNNGGPVEGECEN